MPRYLSYTQQVLRIPIADNVFVILLGLKNINPSEALLQSVAWFV